MFIGFPCCSFKCNIDCGKIVCQNQHLQNAKTIEISADNICERYLNNDLSKAIVIGGFEPFDSPFDLEALVDTFRNKYSCNDTIIIYTGYNKEEFIGNEKHNYENVNYEKLMAIYSQLKMYKNIIIKYGRYEPGHEPHEDKLLGVKLASNNQYAEKLS